MPTPDATAAARSPFEAALDSAPDDWPLRLVYADWLDENGDPELAFAQRWMGQNQKCPGSGYSRRANLSSYDWFDGDDYHKDDPEDIPHGLFVRLPGGVGYESDPYREYATRSDAERHLADALAALTREAAH